MSSELERLLREARESLPGPGDAVTKRARARALAAIRRRGPRVRVAALVGIAFAIALVLGAGIGTLIAPSGTAARGPVGLGFLPEPGWYVLQSGARATLTQPATAVAANVAFDPDDDVRGLAESSGLPYATLLELPPRGIVIVATFIPRGDEPWADARFDTDTLPLRMRDAVPYIQYGAQVRPEQPLAQYELRAAVGGHNVDLNIYFGTPTPSTDLIAEAQRQLDRLVVGPARTNERAARQTVTAPSAAATPPVSRASGPVIDRTMICETDAHGGIHEVEARAHAGYRSGSSWAKLPYAIVTTGGAGGALSGNQAAPATALAWITAGSPVADTTVDSDFYTFPVKVSGTLGIHRTRCKASKARVALTRDGLRGGAASALGDERDCVAPRRVLLRVRARLQSAGTLKRRQMFFATNVPLAEAKLVVRTLSGKPLVYAQAFQSGKTPFFTARSCVRD
ncbi:MAG: hypothetical protein ACRDNY_10425 [Gaiellaceae bacterium]